MTSILGLTKYENKEETYINYQDTFKTKISVLPKLTNERSNITSDEQNEMHENQKRLENLFESDALTKLFKDMEPVKKDKTKAILRQMSRIDHDSNDILDDEIKNMLQMNMLNINMNIKDQDEEKEKEKGLDVVNEVNEVEEEVVNFGRLGNMAGRMI